MISYRRSAFVFLVPKEVEHFDLQSVLTGKQITSTKTCVTAVSAVAACEYSISVAQQTLLSRLSAADWTQLDAITSEYKISEQAVTSLAEFGLLISDSAEAHFANLRRRDEDFAKLGWNKYAALQYSMSRWRNVDAMQLSENVYPERVALEKSSRLEFNKNSDKHGPPPGHFAKPQTSSGTLPLPLPIDKSSSRLQEILGLRETCRDFDSTQPVTIRQLSTVLYHAFGCHGYYELADDLVILKKTSPSGGSLHPTEVYPFIQNVEGMATGLYHYSVREHALTLVKSVRDEKASDLAVEFTAGQEHFRNAHALLILTSRFARHNWKYRDHDKAYRVVLLDAGHLSQSVYLLCAELGLGAFITGAINEQNIEDALAIDGISEGVVAVLGLGVRIDGGEKLSPPFHEYDFGKTKI